MRINWFLLALFSFFVFGCSESSNENKDENKNSVKKTSIHYHGLESYMNQNDFPFYHGIASGDPTQSEIIIWTRVTPKFNEPVEVVWKISENADMSRHFDSGKIITDSTKDFTVKIDVKKLKPGTNYFYQFEALNLKSPIGKTKTISENPEEIKLAFASCSNMAWGYFNAYQVMGDDTLDAVIHLGDYIYEHEPGIYDGKFEGRSHIPAKELISLQEYRTRYAQYRLDKNLQYVHSKHPFITIWDDHELANNAYKDGAGNHQENEGDWKERLAAAKKAYYEWMPIRENNGHHYRSFQFGDLANLIMLDTRTEERDKQPEKIDLQNMDSTTHIIDKKQMDWLIQELLKNYSWTIIGSQILFSDLNIYFGKSPQLYNDGWSAYRSDHDLLEKIMKKAMSTIIVSGDFHSSFGWMQKESTNSENAFDWIEFVVPSINSANYDEDNSIDSALIYKKWFDNGNENLFYSNLIDHGYFKLTLKKDNCWGKYIYVNTVKEKNNYEFFTKNFTFNRKGLIK